MSGHVEISPTGSVTYVGEDAVKVFRMITLANGLKMEIKGLRMTRGTTCYAVIKREFGLKGNKQKVLDQFLPLVEEAKAGLEVRG